MDIDILAFLTSHRPEWLGAFMNCITFLGSEITIIVLACAVFWCVNRRFGNRMLLTLFTGILINQALKVAFCVKRPWLRSERVKPYEGALADATGYSFPSGHTANAVSAFGSLSMEKRLKKLSALFWGIAVLIGISRMVLGVHTPQDVLVSFVIGIALVYLIDKLLAALDKNPKADAWIALAGVLSGVALCVFALVRPYPDENGIKISMDALKLAGAAVGLMSGWYMERRKIKFEIPKEIWKKLVRLLGGLALVLCVLKGLKAPINLLLGETAGSFARYALVGFAATCLWPLIFVAYEGKMKGRQ